MKRLRVLLLAAVMLFSLAVPCFASFSVNGVSYPDTYWVDDKEYSISDELEKLKISNPNACINIVVTDFGTYMYRMKKPMTYANGKVVTYNTGVDKFALEDGKWIYKTSFTNTYGTEGYPDSANTVASTSDILASDGSVWLEGTLTFLPPLPELIQEVTGEEMTKTLPEMVGTMKVLVLCGVGLMASLVVLKLFGKRSLTFLRR